MDNLSEEIKKLQEKAVRYDNLREYVDGLAEKLQDVKYEIDQILSELKPTARTKETSNINYDEIMEQFYVRMQQGTEVSRKLVEATFPEWKDKEVAYLMTKLGLASKVQKRKEGRNVFLYLQKETRL